MEGKERPLSDPPSLRAMVTFGRNQLEVHDSEELMEHARWRVHRFLTSSAVQSAVAFVICLNCGAVGYELQVDKKVFDAGKDVFTVAENAFLCVYLLELALRFFAYGLSCLGDNFVKFDVVVVGSGVLELWILVPMRASVEVLSILVILRILRLFRLARSVKLLVRFREMAILVKGLMTSMGIMIYIMIMLFVMLFIFACMGKELVGYLAHDEEVDPEVREIAHRYFSTVTVAMLTLVQFVCLDSVAAIFEPIVKARPLLATYFVLTILVIGIVLMNLVTAVMVSSAIEKAEEDRDLQRQLKKDKQEQLVHDLKKVFRKLDGDASGNVSFEEFHLEDDHLQIVEECLPDMRVADIFHSLDVDNSGSVDREEFVNGILDLVQTGVSPQTKRMATQVDKMFRLVNELAFNQSRLLSHFGIPVLLSGLDGSSTGMQHTRSIFGPRVTYGSRKDEEKRPSEPQPSALDLVMRTMGECDAAPTDGQVAKAGNGFSSNGSPSASKLERDLADLELCVESALQERRAHVLREHSSERGSTQEPLTQLAFAASPESATRRSHESLSAPPVLDHAEAGCRDDGTSLIVTTLLGCENAPVNTGDALAEFRGVAPDFT